MEFVFDKNFDDSQEEDYFESPLQQALFNNSDVIRSPRRSVATSFDEVEFNPPARPKRRTKSKSTKPKYVGTTARTRKWYHFGKITWTKTAWMIAGVLMLRLVFMDNGIIDYHNMQQTIQDKENQLVELREENASLVKEIKKIRTSSAYQRKMAREHLGVIAPNEYLVVFSK